MSRTDTALRGGPEARALAAHELLASLQDPISELARADGPVDFTQPSYGERLPDHLGRLTLSIVGQVISVRAALRIHGLLTERLDALPEIPTVREAAERALAWQPYRSYAAKYLWLSWVRAA